MRRQEKENPEDYFHFFSLVQASKSKTFMYIPQANGKEDKRVFAF